MKANPYRTILGTMGSVGVLLGVLLVALGSGPFAGGGLLVFGTVISVIGLVTVVGWAVLSGVEWAMREREARADANQVSERR